MPKKTSALLTPRGRTVPPVGKISPEQRENMIREAAYFRYVKRDPVPGHDLDDWLAAEVELFGGEVGQQPPEPLEIMELGGQESGVHGFWEDDALKRIIKQHPRKGIPQIESIEPQEAPPKE
ncbi:MAG TPA: DUF2934 domain-containing protein [Gallionellaceae bacterium]|nr:DUF2934 domain-containing protein [Gallionellaceae bacterium]